MPYEAQCFILSDMNDTARDSISYQPATTQGLEDLFEKGTALDTSAQVVDVLEDSPPQDKDNPQVSPGQDWTISQAAKELGISEKTVLRRLQRGTLTGYKVVGQFGMEWRVNRLAFDSTAQVISIPEDRTAPDSRQAADTAGHDRIIIEDLRLELSELRTKLEGAVYRNGYLEAKLEERDNTIKLLTDSQSKKDWWTSFCSWFIGQKT